MVEIDANQVALKEELQEKTRALQREKEVSSESDTFANFKFPVSLELKVDLRIDLLFNYYDDDINLDTIRWIQGEIKVMSNSSNLQKEGGGFHKKGDCLIRWDTTAK